MTKKTIVSIGALCFVLCYVTVGEIRAQDKARFEPYWGYTVLRLNLPANLGGEDTDAVQFVLGNILGWNGGVTTNLTNHFAITADFAGYYRKVNADFDGETVKANAHLHTFLFGPHVAGSGERVRPFAQALFGFGRVAGSATTDSDTSDFSKTGFAASVGGGADFIIHEKMAIRAQLDYFPVRQQIEDINQNKAFTLNNLRFGTGIVFLLGR